MKRAFEAIWEQGRIIPMEPINIHNHTRLLVVIIEEQTFQTTPLVKEARRQSLLASKQPDPDEDVWEANIDESDWRG